MGNTMLKCCSPPPQSVIVYQEKGKIMEFYYPVLASKLMLEHPNHLIVYRSASAKGGATKQSQTLSSKALSQGGDIRVVRSCNKLELGHAYFLVHIPDQYISRFSKYFALSSPKSSSRIELPVRGSAAAPQAVAALVGTSRTSRQKKRPMRSKAMKPRQRRCPTRSPGYKKSPGRSLWGDSNHLQSYRRLDSSHQTTSSQSRRKYYHRSSWKPTLESIPESSTVLHQRNSSHHS